MARKHGGLGRGLDALIPKREEVEEAMRISDTAGVEVLFSDEEEDNSDQNGELEKNFYLKEDDVSGSESVSRKESEDVSRETSPVETDSRETRTVRISEIEPNRGQPRKKFDESKLEELADSISKYGLLQPILVQDCGDHYEIIAGERRWRASLKAGLKEVPVIVRNYSNREILELSLIENIQRENLNPIEEARAYRQLMDEFGLTQEEVAERVSKSRSAVTNAVRLLKLDEDVQKMVIDGKLSMGHARALISVENAEEQKKLAQKICDEKLSVRAVEKEVREIQENKNDDKEKERDREKNDKHGGGVPGENNGVDLIYNEIKNRLEQSLNTKVAITRRKNGQGKIQIDFYSNDDLEKIIDRLMST